MSEHDRTGGVMRGRRAAADDPDEELLAGSDDLRYEGPIGFDDPEDAEAGFTDDRGGKVFLTAALLGAAVILLVGVALFLRRDGNDPLPTTKVPGAESSANANVPLPRVSQADGSIASENPAKGASVPLDNRLPGAETSTAPVADVAPRPADPLPTTSAPGTHVAETVPAPAVSRPEPTPAALHASETVEQRPPVEEPAPKPAPEKKAKSKPAAPAVAEESAPASTGGDIHKLVAAGDLKGAAKAGAARAQGGKYSLQVAYACKAGNVKGAFKSVADDTLFLVPGKKAGCYHMLWGTYPTRADAKAGLESVPAKFKGDKPPFVVALAKVGK